MSKNDVIIDFTRPLPFLVRDLPRPHNSKQKGDNKLPRPHNVKSSKKRSSPANKTMKKRGETFIRYKERIAHDSPDENDYGQFIRLSADSKSPKKSLKNALKKSRSPLSPLNMVGGKKIIVKI